jgi:nitroimidazol reductase NimA-like FMN-containing flavoprotein (pyridoxamine 5'-phosphate oxidase superfamily)
MLGSLSTSEIEDLLYQCNLGRIGCSYHGKVYVVPVNYIYDGRSVIAHSVEGLKIRMMRNNPSVCFEVDEVQNNKTWKSVIAQGTYREIQSERERYEAMKLFVDRMLKLKVSTTAHPPELEPERLHGTHASVKPVIYRIILSEKTGRYEKE